MPFQPSHRSLAGAVLLTAVLGLSGCLGDDPPRGSLPADAEPDSLTLMLGDVPPLARVAQGAGQPRTDSYWVQWSTCGEGSRAAMAAANGGREAGWFLVDHLLEDPGISLGDRPVTTCHEAVAILEGDPSDLVSRLARQLLAAELNLAVGSRTCGAAAEAVLAGHVLLSAEGYGGPDAAHGAAEPEVSESMARVRALLSLYNGGRLCL